MPDKPILYLLPGLLCDKTVWAHQAANLDDAASDIRIPSFYGFDSLTAMAASVLANAPDRFAVAGHSMGGRVALEIMRLAPARVSHLALLDTGIHPRKASEAESRGALVDLARHEGMNAVCDTWLPPMVAPRRHGDIALMQAMREMICRANPDIFEGQQKALLNRPDAAAGLGGITCPVLVAVGREDGWSPPAQHEEIAAKIPGSVLIVFEGSGHMAPMEVPEAVTGALRNWLHGSSAERSVPRRI